MWLTEDSRLAKFLLLLIGLGICGGAVAFFWISRDFMGVLALIFGGLVGGLILSPMISLWVGNQLGGGIYFKSDKLKRAPERLDYARGLVENGKYADTAGELRLMLARDFMDIEARMLLMRVYQEGLGDVKSTIETGREYFDHPGHSSNRESVEMLLHFCDLISKDEAAGYLKKELRCGKYSSYDRQILKNRLEAIN